MLYITCYAFFASFLWQCFDLPHYAPLPQNMEISSSGHLRSLELRRSGATAKVSEELSRALQADRWIDGSMGRWRFLPCTLPRGAGAVVGQWWKKSDVLRWAMRL